MKKKKWHTLDKRACSQFCCLNEKENSNVMLRAPVRTPFKNIAENQHYSVSQNTMVHVEMRHFDL